MEKILLLASFIKRNELNNCLDILKNSKIIVNNKIFILRDSSNKNKLILTYNVLVNDSDKLDFNTIIKNTISLHRKKDTNTLYTLNALNEVVKIENDDKLDKNFAIDWDKFRNCILLCSNDELIKIKTIIESIREL